jgi:hypothetical protein
MGRDGPTLYERKTKCPTDGNGGCGVDVAGHRGCDSAALARGIAGQLMTDSKRQYQRMLMEMRGMRDEMRALIATTERLDRTLADVLNALRVMNVNVALSNQALGRNNQEKGPMLTEENL